MEIRVFVHKSCIVKVENGLITYSKLDSFVSQYYQITSDRRFYLFKLVLQIH